MNDTAMAELQTGEGVEPPTILEKAVLVGDLSKLQPIERLAYYRAVCESVGLNPLTRPFQYITLNRKLTLYTTKNATDQLRSIRGISIVSAERDTSDAAYAAWVVTATDKTGRTDIEVGSVPIGGLTGEARSNAIMKALTKAKRRVTLSLAGLGMLDESEVGSVPSAEKVNIDPATGEVIPAAMSPAQRLLAQRAEDAVERTESAAEPEAATESTPDATGPERQSTDAQNEYDGDPSAPWNNR